MDDRWRLCEKPWERLRWARMQAGYERAGDAAESMNLKPDTYRAYERAPDSSKHTALDHQRAQQFARKFKVNWLWLLLGEGQPLGKATEDEVLLRIMRALDGRTQEQREGVAELVERILKAG